MSDQAWVFLGVAVTQLVVLLVAVIGGYYRLKSQQLDVSKAKEAAETAVEQTVSTGNGFAKRVEASLAAISEVVHEANDSVKANRADIAEMRAEMANDRSVVIRHLEDHLRSGSKD